MSALRNDERFSKDDDERIGRLWFEEGLGIEVIRRRFNCGTSEVRCSISRWCRAHEVSFKEANKRRCRRCT